MTTAYGTYSYSYCGAPLGPGKDRSARPLEAVPGWDVLKRKVDWFLDRWEVQLTYLVNWGLLHTYTIWLFNVAMENDPFIDGLPIENGDFPWLC